MKQKENPGYSLPCRLLGPSVPGYSAAFSPPFRIFLCFFHNVQGFYLYLAGGIEKIMSRGEIWKLNRQLSVSGTFGKHCFIPQRRFCKVAGSKGLWGHWSLDWRFVAQTWARTILRTLLLPPPSSSFARGENSGLCETLDSLVGGSHKLSPAAPSVKVDTNDTLFLHPSSFAFCFFPLVILVTLILSP